MPRRRLLQVAVILPIGLVLGWLFLRRGIMASIAGHVTYNGILLALLVAVSTGSGGVLIRRASTKWR